MTLVPSKVIFSRRVLVVSVPPSGAIETLIRRMTVPDSGIVGRPSVIGMTRFDVVSNASRSADGLESGSGAVHGALRTALRQPRHRAVAAVRERGGCLAAATSLRSTHLCLHVDEIRRDSIERRLC